MAMDQQKICDNLDLWTSALLTKSTAGRGSNGKLEAYGIKKLRGLILELAIMGKLVDQDINDESAIEALLRTTRAVRPIDINTQQKVPSGWVSIPLACTIASNIGGGTPSKQNPSYWNGPISWASVKDIQTDKYLTSAVDSITEEGLKNSSSNLIPPGRLLIVTRMGLGKLAINKIPVAINQDLRAIEPNEALDLDFAYLLFKTLKLVGKGVTVKGVTVEEIHSMSIALPPLAEQHRIVAKVDELMALCDQLEQQQTSSIEALQTLVETLLSTLTNIETQQELTEGWTRIADHFDTLFTTEQSIDQLKQTILQLAVMGKLAPQDPNDEPASVLLERIEEGKVRLVEQGKIRRQKPLPDIDEAERLFILPMGWELCRLQEIVCLLGDGLHGTPEYTTNERYYFINGNNLSEGQIVIKPETKTVAQDQYDKYKKNLGENTVLVSINGTLGSVAFYNNEEIILGKSACYFNLAEDIYKRFIKIVIDAPSFTDYAYKNATGTTIKNLGLNAMNSLPVALPPMEEQHRIVAKVDELMALCDALKARLTDAQSTQIHLADAIVEQAVA